MQRRRVSLRDGPLGGELQLAGGGVHPLEQSEVQEGHAAVIEQQEVPRMRVARELPVAVKAAEEEAKDDLADPVTLRLGEALQLFEPHSADELADQDPLARERADDIGHGDERVAGEDAP